MLIKGSPHLIQELNLSIILDLIKNEGPVSRKWLAERTHLSAPAVSTIIRVLLQKGLVEEVGESPSTGGRPARLVMFNSRAGFFIGVDIGGTAIDGAVLDLAGTFVLRKQTPTHGSEGVIGQLTNLIRTLIQESKLPVESFKGIGLGIPGVTDSQGQQVTLAPALSWEDLDIGSCLQDEFSLPIWADNDVNAFVGGERWLGKLRGIRNGIGISIGTGIGVGLLLGGDVYRGERGAAGEIGYWVLGNHISGSQNRHKYGYLESFAAGPGIAQRATEALQQHQVGSSILREMASTATSVITAKEVFLAAKLGDNLAQRIVDETCTTLGIMAANLAALLDVERIVIGGGVSEAGDYLVEPIIDVVQRLSPFPPEIVVSSLQKDSVILGAVAGLMDQSSNSIKFSELA